MPHTTDRTCSSRNGRLSRHERKWPASRIAFELDRAGTPVSRRTVTRLLAQLGLNRRKFIDQIVLPITDPFRQPDRYVDAGGSLRRGARAHLIAAVPCR